jgi:hypothetical protein
MEQQMAQQTQSATPTELQYQAEHVAVLIATLARQLSDLSHLEEDVAKKSLISAESAEIIQRSMRIARYDNLKTTVPGNWEPPTLKITVPDDWEPPSMLEPCPSCKHMRSKGKRS